MKKTRNIVIAVSCILFVAAGALYLHQGVPNELLTNEQKKTMKFDYKVKSGLMVTDIVSKDKLLVEEITGEIINEKEKHKLQIYDLETKEYTPVIERESNIYDAFAFEDCIIWTEKCSDNQENKAIYAKYFSDEEIVKIDEFNSYNELKISAADNHLAYYLYDKSEAYIKVFDIKEKTNKTLAEFNLPVKDGEYIISSLSANDFTVAWSINGNVYRCNIEECTVDTLSENSDIHEIVLTGDRLFGEKINKNDPNKDLIVEYNIETKTWDRLKTDKFENFEDSSKERSINFIGGNKGLLAWTEYKSGIPVYYVYDIYNDELVFPMEGTNSDFMVKCVKNHVIYYGANNYDEPFNFVYKYPEYKE